MSDTAVPPTPEDLAEAQRLAAEQAQARGEQAEQAMREQGQTDSTPAQVDYFAFDERHTVYLPDGVSFVVVKALNEGARKKYLNAVNREVRLQKATGDAVLKMATGDERVSLLEESIVDWNLTRGGAPVVFRDRELAEFLKRANPKIVDIIEKKVREINPWLTADVSIEDIDKQIAELEELREEKLREQEGNDD